MKSNAVYNLSWRYLEDIQQRQVYIYTSISFPCFRRFLFLWFYLSGGLDEPYHGGALRGSLPPTPAAVGVGGRQIKSMYIIDFICKATAGVGDKEPRKAPPWVAPLYFS